MGNFSGIANNPVNGETREKNMNKPMKPDPTFHASPILAMRAPVENFAFTIMLGKDTSHHDGLAVIDLRKDSKTCLLYTPPSPRDS